MSVPIQPEEVMINGALYRRVKARCAHENDPEVCPYCDLCEHGKMRTQRCDDCQKAFGRAWAEAPLSDEEIDLIVSQLVNNSYMSRTNPHPRSYECVYLGAKVRSALYRGRG